MLQPDAIAVNPHDTIALADSLARALLDDPRRVMAGPALRCR